jgi:hypothetical protein
MKTRQFTEFTTCPPFTIHDLTPFTIHDLTPFTA